VNEVVCRHKDCERTDAHPLLFTDHSRDGQVKGRFTLYFCDEHRDALFALETTPSLPPAEWFEDDSQLPEYD
jgi:hypothetical protein